MVCMTKMKVYNIWGMCLIFCLSMIVQALAEDVFVASSDSGFSIGTENATDKAVIIGYIKSDNAFFATVYYNQDDRVHRAGLLIEQETKEYKHIQLLYECLKEELAFGKVISIKGMDSRNSFIVSWESEPLYNKFAIVTYANGRFTKQPFAVGDLDAILTKGKAIYARKTAPSWDKSQESHTNEWKMLPSGLDQAQMDEIAKNLAANLGKNTPDYIVIIKVLSPNSLMVICSYNTPVLFSKEGNEWVLKFSGKRYFY